MSPINETNSFDKFGTANKENTHVEQENTHVEQASDTLRVLPAFRANERERSDDQDTFLTLGAAILYFKEKSLLLGFKLIVGRVKGRKVYLICNQNRTLKCACSFTISHE